MNNYKLLLCAGLLALSATALGAVTPQKSDSLHTKVWSVYAQGGISMAKGLEIESVNAPTGTDISPLYGLGFSYQFKPWVRMSLNYEYSKYSREQRFSSIQPITEPKLNLPDMELVEISGGQTYHKTWTGYHNVDLTGDFNILELWKKRQNKWFNLYLSTGVGVTMAYGNSYDISMGYEHWEDPSNYLREAYAAPQVKATSDEGPAGGIQVGNNHEIYSWVNVDNNRHSYKAPYIPVNLAAEFDVSPRIALGAKLMYKYVFSDEVFAPDHLMAAVATVRFNLVGKKHGYLSDKKRYLSLKESYDTLRDKYRDAQKACADNAAALADRIKALEDENEALKNSLTKCEAEPKYIVEQAKPETSVQFLINSAEISGLEKTRFIDFIKKIKSEDNVTLQIVAEASADGKAEYNQKLSERRLAKVISMLKENGISEDRISFSEAIGASKGIFDPIARRVIIKLD